MKKSISIFVLFIFICFTTSCRTVKNIEYKDLEKKLIDFLIQNGDIHKAELDYYRTGERDISIVGFFNNTKKDVLINGIYTFYQNRTHARIYYVLLEDGKYKILNISSREGLDLALNDVLDFCDRNKICGDITEQYVNRIVGMYYKKNINPTVRIDINCEKGITDTKDLP